MTTALIWVLVILLLPIHALLWATESRHTRIQRLRRQGHTWQQIATRYHCAASTRSLISAWPSPNAITAARTAKRWAAA